MRAVYPLLCAAGLLSLSGCAVVTVAGAAVSVGSAAVGLGLGAAGLAVDAGVGAAKLTGKAVGAAVGAVRDDDDGSGLSVRFRAPTAADREKRRLAELQAEEEDRRAALSPSRERARDRPAAKDAQGQGDAHADPEMRRDAASDVHIHPLPERPWTAQPLPHAPTP